MAGEESVAVSRGRRRSPGRGLLGGLFIALLTSLSPLPAGAEPGTERGDERGAEPVADAGAAAPLPESRGEEGAEGGEPGARGEPVDSAAAPLALSRPANPCDGAWAIDRLDAMERSVLHRVCEGKDVSPRALHQTLRRLLGGDGWQTGALAWLVGPQRHSRWTWAEDAPVADRSKPPALEKLQRDLDRALSQFSAGGLCREFRDSELVADFLEAASNDQEAEELPFDADFLRCLKIDPRASEGTRLLTIRTDGLDSLVVAFGGGDSTLTRYFGRGDMMVLGKHRFVIVAVPEGTPVTLVGDHRGQEVPLQWRSVVGRNQAVWMVPVRQACVSLNVRMGDHDRLFVDGQEVPSLADEAGGRAIDQPMILSRDLPQAVVPDHEISVLTCAEDGTCAIRYISRIPAAIERAEPRHVCEPFRLDLRPRTRQQVAIIRTSRSETCEQSPLWADDLRDRIRYFLSSDARHRGKREMADVFAYAEISGALASLEGEISQRPGNNRGPDRGVDTSQALGTVAKEAWRQGLDILMTFEVQCQPKTDNGDEFLYSLQGTMIGVDEIFGRGFYGDQGLDLDRYIRVESISFESPSHQDAALAALLDRLFTVPSSRFIHDQITTDYRDAFQLRVGTVFPPGGDEETPEGLRVIFKRIPRRKGVLRSELADRRRWRPQVCDRLTRISRAEVSTMDEVAKTIEVAPGGAKEVNLVLSQKGADHSVSRQAGVHSREIRPSLPGWYLVVRQDEGGRINDAVCVEADYERREIWGEVMAAGGPTVLASTDVSSVIARARVGYVAYLTSMLGFGVRGGYQLARYNLSEGVASWQDLDVLSPAIKWQRHALTLGPLVEARTRFAVLPVELRARLSPYVDLGVVSIPRENVPVSLAQFRTTTTADSFFDFDVGVDLDLVIGYTLGGVSVQHGVLLGVMALDDKIYETGVTAAENFGGVFGFTLGVGGGTKR